MRLRSLTVRCRTIATQCRDGMDLMRWIEGVRVIHGAEAFIIEFSAECGCMTATTCTAEEFRAHVKAARRAARQASPTVLH